MLTIAQILKVARLMAQTPDPGYFAPPAIPESVACPRTRMTRLTKAQRRRYNKRHRKHVGGKICRTQRLKNKRMKWYINRNRAAATPFDREF